MSENANLSPSTPPCGTWARIAKFAVWGLLIAGGLTGVVVYAVARQYTTVDELVADDEADSARPPQPVRVIPAQRRQIRAWVFAEGTARSVQREYLTFERAGRVVHVRPGADGGDLRAGETVKAGEVLARLDDRNYQSEIETARASLEEAKTQAEAAAADIDQAGTQYDLAVAKLKRSEDLIRKSATSQADYEEAQANVKNAEAVRVAAKANARAIDTGITAAAARLRQAELTLEEIRLVSPIDGVVAYLNIDEGYYFTQTNIRTTSEADALMTIPMVVIDPTRFEITVDVPAFEARRIHVGQPVELLPGGSTGAALAPLESELPPSQAGTPSPDWQARGTVFSVNPAVNPGGRSVQVKIRTDQGAASQLVDGMFVTCWIEAEKKDDAVTAPFDVFLYEENRPYVFVLDKEHGVARRRDVELGIQGMSLREILSGAADGELLISDGRYRLVDEAPVRVVSEIAAPAPPHSQGEAGVGLKHPF